MELELEHDNPNIFYLCYDVISSGLFGISLWTIFSMVSWEYFPEIIVELLTKKNGGSMIYDTYNVVVKIMIVAMNIEI